MKVHFKLVSYMVRLPCAQHLNGALAVAVQMLKAEPAKVLRILEGINYARGKILTWHIVNSITAHTVSREWDVKGSLMLCVSAFMASEYFARLSGVTGRRREKSLCDATSATAATSSAVLDPSLCGTF